MKKANIYLCKKGETTKSKIKQKSPHNFNFHRLPAEILKTLHHPFQSMVFFASIRQFNLLQIEPGSNAFQLHNYIPMVMIWFMFRIVEIAHGKMFPDVHLQILEKLIALHVELFDWHLIDEQRGILLQKKTVNFNPFFFKTSKILQLKRSTGAFQKSAAAYWIEFLLRIWLCPCILP